MATPDGKPPAGNELSHWEGVLKRDPRSQEFYRLADAYTRAARFADAIEVCRRGLMVHPHIVEGHVSLGRALFGAGQLVKATQVLRKCVGLKSPSVEAFRLLGEVLLWQDAPREAVLVLENAMARGLRERNLEGLLQRARLALKSQMTDLVNVTGSPRGMGNVAVAGTIGGSEPQIAGSAAAPSWDSRSDDDFAKTPRVDLPDAPDAWAKPSDPDALKDTPVAFREEWGTVEDKWSRELDARSLPFPDVDSEPDALHLRRANLNLELAPLIDPLAEGMPPMPPEVDESGLLARKSVRPPEAVAGDLRQTAPFSRPSRITPSVLFAAIKPTAVPDGKRPTLSTTAPERVSPAPEATSTPPSQPSPGLAQPSRPVPDGFRLRDSDELTAARADDKEPDEQDEPSLVEPTSPYAESAFELAPTNLARGAAPVAGRRRRGATFWVLLMLLCGSLGAGGVFLYLRVFARGAGRLAMVRAAVARRLDTHTEYVAAIAELVKARGLRGLETRTDEAELLRSLAWLQFRAGEPPSSGEQFETWPQAMAQAALALARNDPRRALSLLDGKPSDRANQGMHLLLVAWASWLLGKTGEAEQRLKEARACVPDLTGVDVLEGLWRREEGELVAAEQALRRALGRAPGHEVALAGLCAVLLTREPKSSELTELLARPMTTPVGKSWHRVLAAEREFLLDRPVDLANLLAAAPESPAVMFHAVEVLGRTGRLAAARDELTRLKLVRGEDSGAMRLLDAELLIEQGLEPLALERLTGLALPRARRLRAWALALLGRGTEIAALLHDDNEDAAQPLRLLAEGLRGATQHSEALRQLSERSPGGKLAYLLLLLARGQNADAMNVAKQLAEWPQYRLRALVVQAQLQLQEGRVQAALEQLDAIERLSPSYLPAAELRGRIAFDTGDTPRAMEILGTAAQAGRRTPELTEALIKALALSGRGSEAARELDKAQAAGLTEHKANLLLDYVRVAEHKSVPPGSASRNEVRLQIAVGDQFLQQGKLTEAEAAWREAHTLAPAHPLPHLRLGALYDRRWPRKALQEFERAIERCRSRTYFPHSFLIEALVGKARSQLAGKQVQAAIAQARLAVKEDRHSAPAYGILAKALLAARRYGEAQEALEAKVALGLDVSDADSFFMLATAPTSDQRLIRQALQRFLQLEPEGKRAALARRMLNRVK